MIGFIFLALLLGFAVWSTLKVTNRSNKHKLDNAEKLRERSERLKG